MNDSSEDKRQESADQEKGPVAPGFSSRRRFLKKSTSAAAVATLASQPVWGACTVSGAMSGGSRPNDVPDPCDTQNIPFSGRSPGFWSQAMYGNGNNGNGNAILSAFSSYSGLPNSDRAPIKAQLICYVDEVKQTNSFTYRIFNADGSVISAQVINVADALSSPGGLAWNLAAIWLDAFFGFFPAGVPGGGSTAQDWVDHFNVLELLESGIFTKVFDNDNSGPSNTSWTLPSDYTCS